MFTGLIEHMGTVSSVHLDDAGCTLTISDAAPILGDCHIGDSIAVNGACLTVTEFHASTDGGWFKVWLANETLQRTDLGERKVGDQVNLERAMGAHPDGDSLRLTFELSAEGRGLLAYIIPKGYVTIDGASLTLTNVDDAQRRFSVMLIQHTQEKITLARKPIGGKVNIEVDMIAKYIEKSVINAVNGGGESGFVLACNNHLGRHTTLLAPGVEAYNVQVTVRVVEPRYLSRSPSPLKSASTSEQPVFRPKAKINSSATVTRKAPSSVVSSSSVRTAPAPRTQTPVRNGVVSPTSASSGSRSAPPPPRPRAAVTRGVAGSGARTPQSAKFDASRASAEIVDLSGTDEPDAPSPRIKAKLSNLAKHVTQPSDESPSPRLGIPLQAQHRPRVASVSSTASSSVVSSGISRVNNNNNHYQSFYSNNNNVRAHHPDPTTIPLPTHSPPMSAVSFSSRSSHSAAESSGISSQLSSAADRNVVIRGGLENLLGFSAMLAAENEETETDDDDEDLESEAEERIEDTEQRRVNAIEREVRAEAKSVRKIADLEITNKSLLTINATLEQTKHRQAKEIRDLRRKLRESRLVLPPREYRAMDHAPEEDDEQTDEDEDEEAAEAAERALSQHDKTYRRIKVILEGLIDSGKRALETTPKDFPEPVKVTKVLSAYEMNGDDEYEDGEGDRSVDPSRVAVPDSDSEDGGGTKSEDEVEAMTKVRASMSPSPAPSPRPK
ncbi:hypothetical protein HMN09_00906200 [Mycena chlorophos]|uniref:Riboflavin synthase n=1 Tax=Mycena chlorophos TaxID=658473 RepID=A0A8H6SN58_MYCCL|nr:hypothetical protein HMN09_00906200 [Mycena chlorophos]